MARIVVVGEGMLELARDGDAWRLGHGGDTLNTAIHLARLGHDVAFVTALGDDPFSSDLRDAWRAEGVDTALILIDPDRRPGLYAITTDAGGERSFTYWRGESAARRLFALDGIDRVVAAATETDVLLFSLITLAVLPPDGRAALLQLAQRVRLRGGQVVFDTNYRPRLWPNPEAARAAHEAALAVIDIGLPTIEDEATLIGLSDAVAVQDHWRAKGVREVITKLGGAGCVVDGVAVPPPSTLVPRDTSGAGDAFNAGYLHARLGGKQPVEAALAGHRLAGWVVMQIGAIPAVTDDAPYRGLA